MSDLIEGLDPLLVERSKPEERHISSKASDIGRYLVRCLDGKGKPDDLYRGAVLKLYCQLGLFMKDAYIYVFMR
jgi:hypothetical protein